MTLQGDLILRPKTLAWIEQAGREAVLPVVWFGCVHGFPTRLIVGLRDEPGVVGGEDRVRRFCLCWMRDRSAMDPSEEKATYREIVRIGCHDGQIADAYGTLILSGRLEKLTIGQRTFSAGQVDFSRFLGSSSRADA
jgi:hypothetical protein